MSFRLLDLFLLSLITTLILFLTLRPVPDAVVSVSEPSIDVSVFSDTHSPMPASAIPTGDYYQTIIDNNIFRPLGWRPPVKQPQYELLGTTIYAEAYLTRAMILDVRANVLLCVGVDEEVGNLSVKQIEAKRVILSSDEGGELILSCEDRMFY